MSVPMTNDWIELIIDDILLVVLFSQYDMFFKNYFELLTAICLEIYRQKVPGMQVQFTPLMQYCISCCEIGLQRYRYTREGKPSGNDTQEGSEKP